MFSTLSDEADLFLEETLIKLRKGDITKRDAIENLSKLECENSIFKDVDMTKETKHDFIEHIANITNVKEDDVWDIYDNVYNEIFI